MSDYYISEHPLLELLKYLPVKSLLRFRCVCKPWKDLIDSQEFMLDHLEVQKPRLLVGCEDEAHVNNSAVVELGTLPSVHTLIRPPGIDPSVKCVIVGTHHGVVCLYDRDRSLVLWNPSIRKCLPLSPPTDFYPSIADKWAYFYGFWIDPSTKDFKVVMSLYDLDDALNLYAILYSSVKGRWSLISSDMQGWDWSSSNSALPVMIEGVAHWVGRYINGRSRVILSFDFEDERLGFMEMPNPPERFTPIEWRGTLSLVCCHGDFPRRCDIYTRQLRSWVNTFSFDLFPPTTTRFCVRRLREMDGRYWVLFTTQPDDYIHRSNGADLHNLGLYDNRVGFVPLMSEIRYRCAAYDFVESLLFP